MQYRNVDGFCAWALLGALLCGGGAAWAAPPVYDSGGTGAVARYMASADRASYHGRYSQAIAIDNKALALAPSFAGAYLDRAYHEESSGLYPEALADFDRVFAMHPDSMSVSMNRVRVLLRQGNGAGAIAALHSTLTLPLFSSWHNTVDEETFESAAGVTRLEVSGHMEAVADEYGSIANQLLHLDDASLADMQAMLKLDRDHPEYILASYCYTAAVAGLLASAELACQESIDQNPHDIGQYDSLGYVHLRMKQWDKAIADYNKAIDNKPDLVVSLYGRGVARRAKGDVAGGNADIAAATRDEPDIANIMRRLGVQG